VRENNMFDPDSYTRCFNIYNPTHFKLFVRAAKRELGTTNLAVNYVFMLKDFIERDYGLKGPSCYIEGYDCNRPHKFLMSTYQTVYYKVGNRLFSKKVDCYKAVDGTLYVPTQELYS